MKLVNDMTYEQADRIPSPAIRSLVKEGISKKTEQLNAGYLYDKTIHEKTPDCICVLGGL